MYLMIQNKGVAPVEAFTLLGASTSRDCDDTIGQFGTGTKHSINLLLRERLPFRVYCGKTRLEFQTEDLAMDDGFGSTKQVNKVVCQFGGTTRKKIDLGWVLEFGAIDWTDIGMALREFISNAIDRTVRETGEFAPSIESGDLVVKIVDKMQAKDGYTRVFIKVDEEGEILKYLSDLSKRFLHFGDPEDVKKTFLPKAGRNLTGDTAMIYREGVLVREIKETNYSSVYDYNFSASDIPIDDCRNSNEYTIRAACARLLRDATADELAPILKAMADGLKTFESVFDQYAISGYNTSTEKQREAWTDAWEAAVGDAVVVSDEGDGHAREKAVRKGHKVVTVNPTWASTVKNFGVNNVADVLDTNEREGREILSPTSASIEALDMVWEWLEMTKQTADKPKPGVFCYKELTKAESDIMGFYRHGEENIHVREDIASGVNKYLLKTTLEELAHYVTGATDNSRDFQNFFMDMIVELVA